MKRCIEVQVTTGQYDSIIKWMELSGDLDMQKLGKVAKEIPFFLLVLCPHLDMNAKQKKFYSRVGELLDIDFEFGTEYRITKNKGEPNG